MAVQHNAIKAHGAANVMALHLNCNYLQCNGNGREWQPDAMPVRLRCGSMETQVQLRAGSGMSAALQKQTTL